MKEKSNERQALVPQLRFPEFRGAWESQRVGGLAKIYKGKGISKADISDNGTQPCIRYGELYTIYNELITEVISRTSLPVKELFIGEGNDVIIPSSGETKEDIATAACVIPDGIAFGGDLNVLRSRENGAFLSYYINGPLRRSIASIAQGNSVVHLYPHQIEELPIAVPAREEQQKIADCLSSLDELITAESQKLDALKTHKNGLMQQLFPREGETVPRLRFPEFRDAGEWVHKELSPFLVEHAERVSTDTQLPVYSSTRTGLTPQKDYFDNRELANDGEYGVVPDGYLVYRHMSDDGTFKFNINKTGGPIAVSKEYPVFITTDLQKDFFLHLLNDGEEFKRFALAQKKGGTRTRLYLNVLRAWQAILPSYPEQQKIADCLSSIDELITAKSQKLDALKIHKKGLMQQLFPVLDEVPA